MASVLRLVIPGWGQEGTRPPGGYIWSRTGCNMCIISVYMPFPLKTITCTKFFLWLFFFLPENCCLWKICFWVEIHSFHFSSDIQRCPWSSFWFELCLSFYNFSLGPATVLWNVLNTSLRCFFFFPNRGKGDTATSLVKRFHVPLGIMSQLQCETIDFFWGKETLFCQKLITKL